MPPIRTYLFDRRVTGVIGLAALAVFLFLGASALEVALVYAAIAIGVALFIWFVVWMVRGMRARRAARRLEEALDEEAARAHKKAPAQSKGEVGALRERLQQAVKTIKTSRLGQSSGSAALYELPWYMVIGNPAAGKSTAVVKSGLKFPFADNDGSQVIQGIGGTRNCDWFFTSQGILLDTAGRYAVHEEDRGEWLDFLALLKKHRSKAPINGILIAASVAELSQVRPEAAIQLAKNLRQRVQELTERLEVFAPVYLVFTKADLIAGFAEFFEDRDRSERDRAWGATLPYEPRTRVDAVALFDEHFDELHAGLKELATARMSLHRGQALPPGVLTFPLEFAALKPALRSFVTTLFEDNPYQFSPVFRGFYFTSAVQEGTASSRASDEVAEQFALATRPEHTTARIVAGNGLFLKDLFSKVIFADRHLVRQHASRAKVRARGITFVVAVAMLAVALGAWSWSYLGNRQLISNVRADLDKAVKLQEDRVDLASRLEALELLQDRIKQLQRYRDDRPLSVGLGLFQGEAIERKLRDEYFSGVRQVMLRPVAQALQEFLADVNLNADKLQPMTHTPESGAAPADSRAHSGGRFSEASPASVEDAYNALKTYLMLADRPRMEAGHLADQITRFWRGWLEDNRGAMPREQMIRSAERMISFSLANLQDPAFPTIDSNFGTVDQTRLNLRRVVRGMPARERVYAEVKARASTRFAPVTVARIVGQSAGMGERDAVTGSYAVSGAFTREAWNGFVETAFKEAADNELQSVDWVLKTSARDDLSLEGSPEQIRRALTDLYKTEYVREWQRFMQGISVTEFRNFEAAVQHMNLLGDTANSPIKKLMTALFEQTSWDNPTLLNERMARTQRGFLDWFRQTILRQNRTGVQLDVKVSADKPEVPMGPVGREFAALGRLMMSRDSGPTVLEGYLQALGKVRSRFNQIKTRGDPGPASRQLMATTLEGTGSELSDALKFVDEQMLVGMSDSARASLRPLLVRPLIQSFGVVVQPAETEINRVWAAQVLEPYQRNLAGKYPFDTNSKVEAGAKDIAKVFGPEGAVARFSDDALGALVVRRGNSVTPRTWADLGVRLRPEFGQGFAGWVAPLEGAAAGTGGSSGGAAPVSQWTFQVLPQGAPGLIEYTVEIDGQSLRYRNTAASWQNFVWPNAGASPGVRVTGVTNDGRSVVVFEAPGQNGLTRAIEAAQQRKMPDDSNELTWSNDGVNVSIQLRVVSQPGSATGSNANSDRTSVAASDLRGVRLPALVVGTDAPLLPAASVAAASTGAAQ